MTTQGRLPQQPEMMHSPLNITATTTRERRLSVRLALTVLGTAGDRSEVLLELDAEHTVDDVRRALLRTGDESAAGRPDRGVVVSLRPDRLAPPTVAGGLWARGTLLNLDAPALSVLRDGMVVALDV